MGSLSLETAYDFLEHWEDLTGNIFVDEIMSAHNITSSVSSNFYLAETFFDQFPSQKSLPVHPRPMKKNQVDDLKNQTQPSLPAQPSDLLWLLEQFLLETLPNGGGIDPVSGSEHPTYSVYAKLMNFASQLKYKYHPHVNTLKAMAHLSEQGIDDRRIPANMLYLALEYLRPGSTQKKHNMRRTLPDGFKIDTSRLIRSVGAGPADDSFVASIALPNLVDDSPVLGTVQDVTDDEYDEDDGESSGNDEDDDDDDEAGNTMDTMDLDQPASSHKRKDREDDDDGRSGGPRKHAGGTTHTRRFGLRRRNAI